MTMLNNIFDNAERIRVLAEKIKNNQNEPDIHDTINDCDLPERKRIEYRKNNIYTEAELNKYLDNQERKRSVL